MMRGRRAKLGMALLLLVANPALYLINDAGAQTAQLIVSAAQDPLQNNHFFGPQIVQIVVDDASARDSDTSTSGLSVNGASMPRVHLSNGLWYAYVAEDDSFLALLDLLTDGVVNNVIAVSSADDADNTNSVGAFSIQFNAADSLVSEITQAGGSSFVEVRRDSLFPSLPEPFAGAAVNPDVDLNSSVEPAADWPYIKLLDIQEGSFVDINLASSSVKLTFSSLSNYIRINIDRGNYPLNAEVIATFKDFMWNINPVEEDVVRFVLDRSSGRPTKVIYQPLRNFDPQGNGQNLPDVLPLLASLELDNRQVMEVDGTGNLRYKQAFDNGIVEFADTSGRLVDEFTATQLPLVTFFEKDPNTSAFETTDERSGGRSVIFAGKRSTSATFDYFDILASAMFDASNGSASTARDTYGSGDRASFVITDTDLNTRSNVSEELDGILSETYLSVGTPYPLANNPTFNTLPKQANGKFTISSIRGAVFALGGGGQEQVTVTGVGTFGTGANVADTNPARSSLLALDFTPAQIGGNNPNGFVVNSALTLDSIDEVITFSMTKKELIDKADPFIQTVGKFNPALGGASDSTVIQVTMPKYNLAHADLRHIKLQSPFARVAVEIEASDSVNTLTQLVDFDPRTVAVDLLTANPDTGSFKAFGLIDAARATNANLAQWRLKFTVIFLNAANNPISMNIERQRAVVDVAGLGAVRAEGVNKDSVAVTAFENMVYRPSLDEEGENSSMFAARTDFMTVLHSDTVESILQNIVLTGDPLKIWLPGRFVSPNRLAVSYTDVDVIGVFRQVSSTFTYDTKDATVSWDRQQYRFSQVAYLTIRDEDLNRKTDAVEQYSIPRDGFVFFEFDKKRADTACQNTVPIPQECFARFIESSLTETSANSGVFRAQITMPQMVLLEDGLVIRAFKSDIEANYMDVRDASSNAQQFTANAVIRSGIGDEPAPQPQPQPTPQPQPPQPTTEKPAGTKRATVEEAKLADSAGAQITTAQQGQSYRIEGTVHNNTGEPLVFEFIVLVRDAEGATVSLRHDTQSAEASGTVIPAITWKARSEGVYTIEIFVWQNLEIPAALAEARSFGITVG